MTIPPTNNAFAARAYQFAAAAGRPQPAAAPTSTAPRGPIARINPASPTAAPLRAAPAPTTTAKPSISPVRPAAPLTPTRAATPATPSKAAALVAAVVPGSIDFRGDTPAATRSDPASFPLYRKPTDRNEVETALLVGRRLDTTG